MTQFSTSAELFSAFLMGLYICISFLLLTWNVTATDPISPEIDCPQSCHCQRKFIDCNGTNLVAVPQISRGSKQVTSLNLTNNSLQEIAYADFEQFEDLEILDLSDNHIHFIHNGSFQSLVNLTTLNISGNSLTTIPLHCFVGLLKLLILEMNDNKIAALHNQTFSGLSKVERITLSNNVIESIDQEAFYGLTTLRSLHLGRNRLQQVPTEALKNLALPKHLASLQTLVLANNYISELRDCSFEHLYSLKVVQLGSNKISKLSDKAFAPVCVIGAKPTLHPCPIQSLDLGENHLTDINPNAVMWLQTLETLNMNNNNIVSIKTGTFENLRVLEILYLSYMTELSEVQVKSFMNLEGLIELRMHNCPHLSILDEGAFYHIPEIKILKMNNNSLKTISENLMNWSSLSDADFRGNPLICDCYLRWLQDKFKSNNSIPSTKELVCHSPDKLKGIKLSNVKPDLLICKKPQKTPHARLQTALAAVAICLCLVLIIAVFIKFRNRICIAVKRQFRYKAQRDNARELFSIKMSDITEDNEPEAISEEVTLTPSKRGGGLLANL